jgi:hypothetical protein
MRSGKDQRLIQIGAPPQVSGHQQVAYENGVKSLLSRGTECRGHSGSSGTIRKLACAKAHSFVIRLILKISNYIFASGKAYMTA